MIDFEEKEKRPAYVRFERRPIEDKAASLAAGRAVSKDVDFALVTPPFSKDCVEYKVDTWLINMEKNLRDGRIKPEWAEIWKKGLENWRNGQEAPVNGTSVRDWSSISPAQVKNLLSAGCHTIEDLAAVNGEGLKRIGMGGMELRNKAKAWLQAAESHGPLVMEVSALKDENAQLKGTIDSLQRQVNALVDKSNIYGVSENNISDDISVSDIIEPEENSKTLADQYQEKFGKKPHHLMKEENIIKAIAQ